MQLSFPLVACLDLIQPQVSDLARLSLNAFTSHLVAEFRTNQSGKGALKFRQKISGVAGSRICFDGLPARSNHSRHSSPPKFRERWYAVQSHLKFNSPVEHHGIH